MGALPAILGLIVLTIVFASARPVFFTAANFANLLGQGAGVIIIAMGLVFVLLIGEIDLSAGFTAGVCAAVLAVVLTERGLPWYVAILAALVTGSVIGTVLGVLVARVGIPSFVVTLAAFLAFQGVMLLLIQGGSIVAVDDPAIKKINFDGRFTPTQGWILFLLTVVIYAALQLRRRVTRTKRGLTVDPLSVIGTRIAVLAVLAGLAVYVLNLDRGRSTAVQGVPVVVLVIGLLLILWTFVLGRTAYGRHIYAVGGNREAARRAGINVDGLRTSAFIICSTMAAVGGIVLASRAASVDPNTGGSNVLLYAVGAAVIGGTSLFGGKGRVLDAVLGGAVVAVIENGMGLLGYSSGVKYIVTGAVLLLAAGVDALSRRRAAAAGLR